MSTTQQEANVAATAAVGMLAVAEHIVDHRIPAPHLIACPGVGEREIGVLVNKQDLVRWLPTITVDATDDQPASAGQIHRTHHGRLPNGIRVGVATVMYDPTTWVHSGEDCDADDTEHGIEHGIVL